MEQYAQVLSYAIPGFILLILAEAVSAFLMKRDINFGMDVISSLSSGVTNTLKSVLGLTIIIVSYDWLVGHLALFEISSSILIYALAFIGIDFASYWSHRFNHEVNVLWNRHIVHHSSEEFNLSCALRQPISNVLSIYFFLYIPMAILGIPAHVVALLAPLHLFAQFWYHTRLIGRMGFLEKIIVTPSHHRVHHAINPEYIDKNYAAIFILWDKWFGTFKEEDPNIPAVYGTKKPVHSWNPFWINYTHLWSLIKDAWHTKDYKAKFMIWFRPTGWRPQDLRDEGHHPENLYERPKYRGIDQKSIQYIAWVSFTLTLSLFILGLVNISYFSYEELIYFSLYIAFSVYTYTSLMDGHFSSWISLGLMWGVLIWSIFNTDSDANFAWIGWVYYILWTYQVFLTASLFYAFIKIIPAYRKGRSQPTLWNSAIN